MQFLIDTDTESPAGLLIASHVIAIYSALQSAGDLDAVDVAEILNATAPRRLPHREPKPSVPVAPPLPTRPVVVPVAPAIPLPPGNVPPQPVIHPEFHPDATPPADVPTGTETDNLDPAVVFGGARPLAQAAPSAPPAPIVTPATNAPAQTGTGTAESPPTAQAGERDSAGLPWDERIHSETRKKNADGTWRFRRNLDAGVKAAVHAELIARYAPVQQVIPQQPAAVVTSAVPVPPAAPAVPVAPPAPAAMSAPPVPAAGDVPATIAASYIPPGGPVPAAPVAPPAPTATVLPFPGAAPAAPAVPVQPEVALGVPNAPQPPVVQAVATTFRELMQKVNVALAAGKLTQAQLSEACKSAQVEGVTALASQPALVPTVDQYLNRWLAA